MTDADGQALTAEELQVWAENQFTKASVILL